jgi:hypothetical protein
MYSQSFTENAENHNVFTTTRPYELRDRFIADSGSDIHVCNSRNRFINFRSEIGALSVGNSEVASIGRGDVEVRSTRADGSTGRITLQNAVYVPDLHTNIISMDLANEVGVYLNQRLKILENGDGIPICRYFKLFKHNVVDYNKINVRDAERHLENDLENAFSTRKSAQPQNFNCFSRSLTPSPRPREP